MTTATTGTQAETAPGTAQLTREGTRSEVTVAGSTISYHETGEGAPLVMLHGSGPGVSAWFNFRYNLPVLGQRFRVIAPDMPGFGDSELPELDEVYTSVAARRIVGLLDELGIEKAAFIGNSMGGAVTSQVAYQFPDRVQRMALMGSGGLSVPTFGPDPSEGFKRLFEFLGDPTRENMTAWVRAMVFDQKLVTDELIDERMANALAEGAIGRMKAIFGSMFDPEKAARSVPLWTQAHTIRTPTLLMWGRDDRMLPYDQAHFAIRRMPDVELHTFSNCGHWVQVERKAAFERVAAEFLSRPTP